MALTEIYVNPAIAGNSGTGTSGDPYGDLQYAFNTATRDATNGNRFNVKAGTAEVMAAALDLTTYGTPTAAAPVLIQGYTSTAGDGGIGEINNGGSNVSVISSTTLDFVHWADMKLGNTGTAQILREDRYTSFTNVEFHTSSAANAVQVGSNALFARCKFHTLTGNVGLVTSTICNIYACYFSYGVSSQAALSTTNSEVLDCIFTLTGAARGAVLAGDTALLKNCSFYSSAGTGLGALFTGAYPTCFNNIFTGFSGGGGKGLYINAGVIFYVCGANAFYNNATNSDTVAAFYTPTNITLTNAPFTDAAGGDFSIATAAKTELQSYGWPTSFNGISTNQYIDSGAAQIAPSGGGAFSIFRGIVTG